MCRGADHDPAVQKPVWRIHDYPKDIHEKCTMCYRCISRCPQKAITLLGDGVIEQCRFEKYSSGNTGRTNRRVLEYSVSISGE